MIYGVVVSRNGCGYMTWCACAGGSNGSPGWAPFQSGGDVQSDLQTRFAGNGADCERRLSEAALTRCAGDLRPPGSDALHCKPLRLLMDKIRNCVIDWRSG